MNKVMDDDFLHTKIKRHQKRLEIVADLINAKLADKSTKKVDIKPLFRIQQTLNSQLRAMLIECNGESELIEKFDEVNYMLNLGYLLYWADISCPTFEI